MHSCYAFLSWNQFPCQIQFSFFFLPDSTNFNSKQVFSNQPETIPTAAHIFCPRPIVRTGLFFGSEATRGPGCDPARRGEASVQCLLPRTWTVNPAAQSCSPATVFILAAKLLGGPLTRAISGIRRRCRTIPANPLNSTFCRLTRDTDYIARIVSILDLIETKRRPNEGWTI